MKFHCLRMGLILPVFAGALCSLFICIFLAAHINFSHEPAVLEEITEENLAGESGQMEFATQINLAEQKNIARIFTAAAEKTPDFILEKFRDAEYREWVISFFAPDGVTFC